MLYLFVESAAAAIANNVAEQRGIGDRTDNTSLHVDTRFTNRSFQNEFNS